jgi:pimeloyl-ACP methyl ester carboxylesterase
MPTVKVGDLNIYSEVYGEGEPLFLIMGCGADSSWWYPQILVFSREFKGVAFDNRGTGQSNKPAVGYPVKAFAAGA